MQNKEWISGKEGENLKFFRETLLNYAMNRWGLNKAYSIGSTSELIRNCAPSNYNDWITYYFEKANQKKKNGVKITEDYIKGLGQTLYVKLSEVVQNELLSISEEECIDYAYNLVLNRTYVVAVRKPTTIQKRFLIQNFNSKKPPNAPPRCAKCATPLAALLKPI